MAIYEPIKELVDLDEDDLNDHEYRKVDVNKETG